MGVQILIEIQLGVSFSGVENSSVMVCVRSTRGVVKRLDPCFTTLLR